MNKILYKIKSLSNPWGIGLGVFLLVIGLYFAALGIGKFIERLQPSYYAGEIFDEQVPRNQYQKAILHTQILGRLRFGEAFNKIKDFVYLEDQGWERLILLHEAKKSGITVTDEDVVHTIAGYDVFYRYGHFNPTIYRRIIRDTFQCQVHDFEESIRESIILEKFFDKVTSAITLSENDIFTEYKKKNDKFTVNYIFFPSQDYLKSVSSTPDEERKYYEDHKEDFLKQPSIDIEYVKLFFPEEGGVQKQVETKYKTIAIHDDFLKDPKRSLKDIAPKYQSSYHFDMNESGLFSKDKPFFGVNWSFETMMQSFRMRVNQVSDPIELTDGYLIYRIKDKRGTYLPKFEEIQGEVKKKILQDKAQAKARQEAQDALNKIQNLWQNNSEKLTFIQIAQKLNLAAKEGPPLTLGQDLSIVGTSKDLEAAIFALTPEAPLSRVADVPDGSVITSLQKREDVDPAEFEKDKTSIIPKMLNQKREEFYQEFLAALKKKSHLRKNVYSLL